MSHSATSSTPTPTPIAEVHDLDRPLRLHPLIFLDEPESTTLGRADTDTYAVLPPDGAQLVRRLAAGTTPREAAEWYETAYGEPVDIAELLAALEELDFVRADDTPEPSPGAAAPIRWQRLGAAVFSPLAAAGYALVAVAAILLCTARADLTPHYRQLFFTDYFTVMELVLFLGQFPLMLVHESAHALAGRRLGLRSRLRVSRRLYFLVLETSLDGLVAVERRRRFLPMLAGMGADVVVWSVLVLLAEVSRQPDGTLSLLGRICLALAFGTLLRIMWQLCFYLRTDVYHLISTVLGCVDLHGSSVRVMRNRFHRLLDRTARISDESLLHPADRRAARWYGWLMGVGYTVTLTSLCFIGLPTMYTFLSGVVRGASGREGAVAFIDAALLIALNAAQVAVVITLTVRERRRTRYRHVLN
ncbi:hypothetical protein AB0D49_24585 [Streptomyces sp. NPDC048290]|uniref:hypothetical protein n=1 Tax=Streptomyces sp. NPDC048290 TaxID=3155811 RepID=UPI0034132FC7